jgi:hypothetical protein
MDGYKKGGENDELKILKHQIFNALGIKDFGF